VISFLQEKERIAQELKNKEVLVFLDYDGTLTPIVDTPDLAVLSEDMRAVIKRLAQHHRVAIVSGRATDDVRSKVLVEGIFYAGSHGFEIIQPDGSVEINKKARAIRSTIEEVYQKLTEQLKDVPGALIEDVKYTISTHYRLVSKEDFFKVKEAVDYILKAYPQLRMTSGKKVFELRPTIDWDKGKAVEWILDHFEFDAAKQAAIYIGDDTTDEDAFAVLKDKGFGILVAD